ncbi:peptidoglycan binding protein [Oleiphilus messinensis]|uniref:Peptidoglycan binding protein n=1 Tax=Oleiphilus messinensis TaxID=141451 RepID=A0A1Y0IBA0_9GAMM|nr:LysM peptidoglycan-binding domain-containing protein [Oleiphilus messinensis]ARU56694.1 peptidoglycan binding protein [Oleiphilus messinensis]
MFGRFAQQSVQIISMVSLLAGCAGLTPSETPKETTVETKSVETAPPTTLNISNNPQQNVDQALKFIQNGSYEDAREMLTETLKRAPDHRLAKFILDQLQIPPQQYFGPNYRFHTVRRGESLSKIAKSQLGNPLLFVALARYNEIEQPEAIDIGMKLKIPEQKNVVKPESGNGGHLKTLSRAETDLNSATDPDNEMPSPPSEAAQPENNTSETTLTSLYEKGEFENMLNHASRLVVLLKEDEVSANRQLIENVVTELAREQEQRKLYRKSLERLNQGIELIGETTNFNTAISRLNRKILTLAELEQFDVSTLDQVDRQIFIDALMKFPTVFQDHKDELAELKSPLINSFHRHALLAFRQQSLDDAILYWNTILKIDPENELAIIHKSRAITLQRKLQKISD